jgi:Sodium:dicarboxylate symporter family
MQVLVAVVIGIGIGVWFPNPGATLKPLGDSFVALIRMALAPIIFGTVVGHLAISRAVTRRLPLRLFTPVQNRSCHVTSIQALPKARFLALS